MQLNDIELIKQKSSPGCNSGLQAESECLVDWRMEKGARTAQASLHVVFWKQAWWSLPLSNCFSVSEGCFQSDFLFIRISGKLNGVRTTVVVIRDCTFVLLAMWSKCSTVKPVRAGSGRWSPVFSSRCCLSMAKVYPVHLSCREVLLPPAGKTHFLFSFSIYWHKSNEIHFRSSILSFG